MRRKGLPLLNAEIESNIRAWYAKARPEHVTNGLAWYSVAAGEARHLAAEYGKSFCTVAGIIAALSPSVEWEHNLIDARSILAFGRRATVSTYGTNKRKALKILRGAVPSDVLGGDKVIAFYTCIAVEGNTRSVCLDRHAVRAALNCSLREAHLYIKRAGCYEQIVAAYFHVAISLGLMPAQLQAIVWLVFRADETRRLDSVPF